MPGIHHSEVVLGGPSRKSTICATARWGETLNLNLSNEVNDYVKVLVAQGRFNSEEGAIVQGIKLLIEHEQLCGEIQKA